MGYIFQTVALVSNMTAYENIDFFLRIYGMKHKERFKRIKECLGFVGLEKRGDHYPTQMSGGEQQRVAIAIALANDPQLLLADEPTGSVDTKIAYHILNMLKELNEKMGITIVVVTHDPKVAIMVERVISINDGMIGSELHMKAYTYESFEAGDISYTDAAKSHDEFIIVDRKGRIRIPEEIVEKMGLTGGEHLTVELTEDGFSVQKRT